MQPEADLVLLRRAPITHFSMILKPLNSQLNRDVVILRHYPAYESPCSSKEDPGRQPMKVPVRQRNLKPYTVVPLK